MIRPYIKYAVSAVAAGIGVFLFFLSALAWGNLTADRGHVMFFLKQPVSIRSANEIEGDIRWEWEKARQDNDSTESGLAGKEGNGTELMPEFCIWGRKEGIQLTNQNLSRNARADLILFCGNPELLFDDCRQTDREDTEGCLVDEGAAWELFGSYDVTGKKISCEGKMYTIRWVLPGNRKIFACRADRRERAEEGRAVRNPLGADGSVGMEGLSDAEGSSGADSPLGADDILNRITMKKPEGKAAQELCGMWNNRYDLQLQIMDLELLRGIGGFSVLLFPLSACAYFLWNLFCQFRGQKNILFKIMYAVFLAASLLFFGIMLKNQIHIPDAYIPTRWSDFSFWPNLWHEKKDAVDLLLQMPKTNLDYAWMKDFVKTAVCGILAELFFLIFLFCCIIVKRNNLKGG